LPSILSLHPRTQVRCQEALSSFSYPEYVLCAHWYNGTSPWMVYFWMCWQCYNCMFSRSSMGFCWLVFQTASNLKWYLVWQISLYVFAFLRNLYDACMCTATCWNSYVMFFLFTPVTCFPPDRTETGVKRNWCQTRQTVQPDRTNPRCQPKTKRFKPHQTT
jgi:hypothetical protein